ncbi:MAG: hypothetical protein RSN88_06630 [Gordonibacter sp.]|uniref:hypothetical protein n=1 Tax=Gordonibacter sp. TaxID=1968902 RepID=UPI002FC9400F
MNGLKVTKVRECALRGCCYMACWPSRMRAGLRDERGQGTTEYAILVGVQVPS